MKSSGKKKRNRGKNRRQGKQGGTKPSDEVSSQKPTSPPTASVSLCSQKETAAFFHHKFSEPNQEAEVAPAQEVQTNGGSVQEAGNSTRSGDDDNVCSGGGDLVQGGGDVEEKEEKKENKVDAVENQENQENQAEKNQSGGKPEEAGVFLPPEAEETTKARGSENEAAVAPVKSQKKLEKNLSSNRSSISPSFLQIPKFSHAQIKLPHGSDAAVMVKLRPGITLGDIKKEVISSLNATIISKAPPDLQPMIQVPEVEFWSLLACNVAPYDGTNLKRVEGGDATPLVTAFRDLIVVLDAEEKQDKVAKPLGLSMHNTGGNLVDFPDTTATNVLKIARWTNRWQPCKLVLKRGKLNYARLTAQKSTGQKDIEKKEDRADKTKKKEKFKSLVICSKESFVGKPKNKKAVKGKHCVLLLKTADSKRTIKLAFVNKNDMVFWLDAFSRHGCKIKNMEEEDLLNNMGLGFLSTEVDNSTVPEWRPLESEVIAGKHLKEAGDWSWFNSSYAKYIPFTVRERFVSQPAGLLRPEIEHITGVVAFVDISGFTKLSEKLVKSHGTNGAELLNKYISGYFKQLIDVVVDYGGDIIKFAGDAMLVIWRNPRAGQIEEHNEKGGKAIDKLLGSDAGETLSSLVLRCVACQLTLINELNNFTPQGLSDSDVCLTLHTGVGVGELSGIFVGGVNGEWEYYLAGEPIQTMSEAVEEAQSGDVVVDAASWEIIKDAAKGEVLKSKNVRIKQLTDAPQLFKRSPPPISVEMESAVSGFVQKVVKKHVESGGSALWLAEFRECTIMFVALSNLNYKAQDAEVLELLGACVEAVQESVGKFEGTVARLIADDKGTRFKIAFGMPSLVHPDDAVRCVKCALDISQRLRKLKCPPAIGIATGTVFCGDAGSEVRCEYTAVGFKVIMAARLMQAAGFGGILCEKETYELARSAVTFEPKTPIQLKGVAKPVEIFLPHDVGGDAQSKMSKMLGLEQEKGVRYRLQSSSSNRADKSSGKIIKRPLGYLRGRSSSISLMPAGNALSSTNSRTSSRRLRFATAGTLHSCRQQEQQLLQDLKERVLQTKHNCLLSIVSEAGLGKTALLLDFNDSLDFRHTAFAHAVVEPPSSSGKGDLNDLDVFVGLFASMLSPKGQKDKRSEINLKKGLKEDLAVVLSDGAEAAVREATTAGLMDQLHAKFLSAVQHDTPSVSADFLRIVVLENIQWLSKRGAELVKCLYEAFPTSLFLILAARPHLHVAETKETWKSVMELPGFEHLELDVLSKDQAHKVCEGVFKLDGTFVDSFVVDFVANWAFGHPLIIENMAKVMCSEGAAKGIFEVQGQRLQPLLEPKECVQKMTDLQGVKEVFTNLRMALVGRVCQMELQYQMLLKVGAVIGWTFQIGMLDIIYPHSGMTAEKLDELCQELVEMSVLVRSSSDGDGDGEQEADVRSNKYRFKFPYIRHCMYTMLSLDQRKEITQTVAHLLEPELLQRKSQVESQIADLTRELADIDSQLELFQSGGEEAKLSS